jgi:CheY-like chemotaxis protein
LKAENKIFMCNEEKKYHLLLVEDNVVNQQLAVRLLEKKGYLVDTANNGQEAVDRCIARPYDLVLMDCQMPIMDGFEASRAIREIAGNMPIVALTGGGTREDNVRCLAAGMNDVTHKPINFSELNLIIQKWLQHAANTVKSNNN